VHFGVTRNPTDAWVAQRLREATPFSQGPRYLIRDNDRKYGRLFARVASGTDIEVFAGVRTPALGGDLTSVKCNGEWLPLGLAVDDTTGLVVTGVSAYWLQAVQGLVIVTAIMLDQLRKRRR
jgi:hypothetical protein